MVNYIQYLILDFLLGGGGKKMQADAIMHTLFFLIRDQGISGLLYAVMEEIICVHLAVNQVFRNRD